jgi:cytochrome P450
VSGLLAAGSETTATGGMLSITTLLEHPESLERVRADRALIPQTVSEILRFAFGGLGGMRRFAVTDFELHGRTIRKGEMLLLSLGGASHDPRVYPDPERFDIDRNPQNLMTFGNGPHYCLGANLARGELECMIDAALDFLPPGARYLRSEAEVQTIGLFDRPMTCPVDFGPPGSR